MVIDRSSEKQHQLPEGFIGLVYHNAEWMITAVSVTIVFIVFVMQAYTIPTGSMADTLQGAHFRLRCIQCGYEFNYGFIPRYYGYPDNYVPLRNVEIERVDTPRCPNCGYYQKNRQIFDKNLSRPVTKGDRIFVLKCIYQFVEPARWDVIVFKDPLNPKINYIKRLIGLPGEKLQIIDGDIYINGSITRKPENIQDELWMPVYNNDYQPAQKEKHGYNGHSWAQPFQNVSGSKWYLNSPTGVFELESLDDTESTAFYNTKLGNDFSTTYAYDNTKQYRQMPVCSDLKIDFCVENISAGNLVGAVLGKYGRSYKGFYRDGKLVIAEITGDASEILCEKSTGTEAVKGKLFSFSNVDYRLILTLGNERLVYDLGKSVDSLEIKSNIEPQVAVLGAGKLKLSHIAVDRDTHYISTDLPQQPVLQARQPEVFEIEKDQFFVCGDNSPGSFDCRYWDRPGYANYGKTYRQGIVPRDYLIGKAFFIYWPGAFKPFNNSKLMKYLSGTKFGRLASLFLNVPSVDNMGIIAGGGWSNIPFRVVNSRDGNRNLRSQR